MSDTFLGTRDIAMNMKYKNPCLYRAYILEWETDNKQVNQ